MPLPASLAILSDLVAFDTTSRNSNLPLIEYVAAYLTKFGIENQRIPDETGTKANLWATIGPAGLPGFVLSGHTDVVPVDGQDWSGDPFRMVERDGRLIGRGTSDMKGFLSACLALVPEMAARPLAQPIHLAFSYDEEVGCIGVRRLLEWLAEEPVRPEACIVGEPTGMQIVTAHKAKRSLKVKVRGLAVHSALAPVGVNAIDYAARLVLKIREIGERMTREGARDELFDVPFTTSHTGTIRGGTALNIVPEDCLLEFEFRALPGEDVDALVDEVRDYAHAVLEPEMQLRAPGAGIDFKVRSAFPGLDTAVDTPVVRLAKALAGRDDHGKVAFGTEGGLFAQIAGIPTVVCGPGSIEQAHTPDEFIALSEIDKCEAFLRRLIDRCAA